MRKLLLLMILSAGVICSCTKRSVMTTDSFVEPDQTSRLKTNVVPGATDSVTMDVTGDMVDSKDTVRNSTTGMKYTPDIQGSGWINGTHTTPVAIVKTSAARFPNSYALRFSLPARSTSVTYDQTEKDRLEQHIIQAQPISNFLNAVHYSGFSIMIPSGKGNAPDWCVIHQMWQSQPESPPISLQLMPGFPARLALKCLWGKDSDHSHGDFQHRVDIATHDTVMDLPRNKWIDFVVKWKLDTAATGLTGICQVYRHDIDATGSTLIWDYSGHLGYSQVNNKYGINEKFGIYRKADYVNNLEIVYDQIRVGPTWASVQPWP